MIRKTAFFQGQYLALASESTTQKKQQCAPFHLLQQAGNDALDSRTQFHAQKLKISKK